MFELLFRYPYAHYRDGHVELSWSWGALAFAVLLAGGFTLWRYLAVRRQARSGPTGWTAALWALRASAFALVLFALAEPVLVTPVASGHRGTVAVLVDDSASMGRRDVDGGSRADWVRKALGPADGSLLGLLSKSFDVRLMRLSGAALSAEEVAGLRFDAGHTDLATGIESASATARSAALAGVVLLSDGANNAAPDASARTLDDAVLGLEAAGVPLMAVGVGDAALALDVELAIDPVPRKIRMGNGLRPVVRLTAYGRAGQKAVLTLDDEGRILDRREVTLGPDGEAVAVTLNATMKEAGVRRLRARVEPAGTEPYTANDAREFLIEVTVEPQPILYVEGEPRFGLKFLRRAVEDDPQIRLVALLRMATNRLYRMGVEGPQELKGGFPETAEQLFRYRALVLGSVDAAFFTPTQRELIEAFVDRRGGGLMMLGGRLSFAEGGWAGTPLAALSPVVLDPDAGGSMRPVLPVAVAGASAHPLGRALAQPANELGKIMALADLPVLSAINAWGPLKPGASVLLEDAATGDPMFVWQRYGRGLVAAFAPRDQWRWQMHPTVAVEDVTHETFWRQTLRWLADGVPGRIELQTSGLAAPGQRISARVRALGADYRPRSTGVPRAFVLVPDGTRRPLDLVRDAPSGDYLASFVPDTEGVYEIQVDGGQGAEPEAAQRALVRVSAGAHEPFDGGLNFGLLDRIGQRTGGGAYRPNDLESMVRELESRRPTESTVERKPLWDLPALLLALILVLALEWPLRRFRGLR